MQLRFNVHRNHVVLERLKHNHLGNRVSGRRAGVVYFIDEPVYVNGSSRLAMSKLKIYGLHLAKSAAVMLAIVGGGAAPVGLAFTSCMDSDQKISAYVNLWKADYCSGMVGLFLVITTAEFFYLGILTEFRLIPRLSGFISLGIMGAIAFAYMVSIIATWD